MLIGILILRGRLGWGKDKARKGEKHVGTVCKSLLHKETIVCKERPFLHESAQCEFCSLSLIRIKVKGFLCTRARFPSSQKADAAFL